jgi:hypothetical protein
MGSCSTKEKTPSFQMIFTTVHVDGYGFNLYLQCPVCVDGRKCLAIVMSLDEYVSEKYGHWCGPDDNRTWVVCRHHEHMVAERCYKTAPKQKTNYLI